MYIFQVELSLPANISIGIERGLDTAPQHCGVHGRGPGWLGGNLSTPEEELEALRVRRGR